MLTKFIFAAVLACVGFALADKTSYEGYKLIKIFPKTQEQADLVSELQHNEDFDLWSRLRGDKGSHVSLSPSAFEKYEFIFNLFKIKYEIVHHNLQEVFDEEDRKMKKRDLGRNIIGKYARYSDIRNWILEQVQTNPTLVSTYVPGNSFEGRELRVIVIKTATSTKGVWIDCGIHAREWVSPATCMWVADRLIAEYKSGVASTVALLQKYEFHIMPLLNPDGYEFSHTNTRLWRKNRNNKVGTCVGVDLNRNFGYQWMTGGSSGLACADTYAGPSANSELETQALQKAINDRPGIWDLYLTIHSYGKWLFTPYGYTGSILPPDYADQKAKADKSVAALQAVHGEKGWVTGSSSQILYVASGGSEDWTYGVAKIKYSYCFELRPGEGDADYGHGFTLPEDRAPLAGEETYQGIKTLVEEISKSP